MADRVNSTQGVFVPACPLWLCVFALLGSAVLVGVSQFPLTDIFWHLKVGEWMLAHHQLLTHDIFSFTFHAQPVVIHSPSTVEKVPL